MPSIKPLSADAPLPDVLIVAAVVDEASKTVSGEAVVVVVLELVVRLVMFVGAIALVDETSLDVELILQCCPSVYSTEYDTRTSELM